MMKEIKKTVATTLAGIAIYYAMAGIATAMYFAIKKMASSFKRICTKLNLI